MKNKLEKKLNKIYKKNPKDCTIEEQMLGVMVGMLEIYDDKEICIEKFSNKFGLDLENQEHLNIIGELLSYINSFNEK